MFVWILKPLKDWLVGRQIASVTHNCREPVEDTEVVERPWRWILVRWTALPLRKDFNVPGHLEHTCCRLKKHTHTDTHTQTHPRALKPPRPVRAASQRATPPTGDRERKVTGRATSPPTNGVVSTHTNRRHCIIGFSRLATIHRLILRLPNQPKSYQRANFSLADFELRTSPVISPQMTPTSRSRSL